MCRFLVDKDHKLREQDWSCRSANTLIVTIDKQLNEIVETPDKSLNHDFMISFSHGNFWHSMLLCFCNPIFSCKFKKSLDLAVVSVENFKSNFCLLSCLNYLLTKKASKSAPTNFLIQNRATTVFNSAKNY